jgi:hypothetical protein
VRRFSSRYTADLDAFYSSNQRLSYRYGVDTHPFSQAFTRKHFVLHKISVLALDLLYTASAIACSCKSAIGVSIPKTDSKHSKRLVKSPK